MSLAGLPFMILLMLMGGKDKPKPPPPWPGQRPPVQQQRPRPRPNRPPLPGFIPPELLATVAPIFTAAPVGPGVPVRPQPRPRIPPPSVSPNPRPRPKPAPPPTLVNLPIRSPGQPTGRKKMPPGFGLPPGLVPPPDFLKGVPIPPQPPEPPPPEVVISPITDEPPPESEPRRKVVIVKPGEGLSQVAQRLGQPGGIADVRALRAANVPHGPDADWHVLESGNLGQEGRRGGLQPGDKLWVPEHWDVV